MLYYTTLCVYQFTNKITLFNYVGNRVYQWVKRGTPFSLSIG